jgi:Glycosyltransferase family 87
MRIYSKAIFIICTSIAISSVVILFYSSMLKAALHNPTSSDFYKFYLSGQRLDNKQSMYWLNPSREIVREGCGRETSKEARTDAAKSIPPHLHPPETYPCLHPNLNPPFAATIFWLVAQIEYSLAFYLWQILGILGMLTSLWIINSTFCQNKRQKLHNFIIASPAFLMIFPTWSNFEYGQVTGFLLLLLTGAWLAMRNSNERTAGILIGIAAGLKPFFGLFFLSFIFYRSWRTAFSMLTTGLISLILGGIFWGLEEYNHYIKVAADITWFSANWNASIRGFLSRTLGGAENTPIINQPELGNFLTITFTIIVLILLYKALSQQISKSPITQKRRTDLLFATTIPAMLLISPLGWIYYFSMMTLTMIVFWQITHEFQSRRVYRLGMLAFVTPCLIPTPLMPSTELNGSFTLLWEASVHFYALLGIFILTSAAAIKANKILIKK